MSGSGWTTKARVSVIAPICAVVVLAVAGPAAAGDVRLDAQLKLGVLADGSLDVEEAKGTISLGHEIASPRDLAWHVSAEDRPVIVGRLFNPVAIQELTIHFSPVSERAQGRPDTPGAVSVAIIPDRPLTDPCGSALWNRAAAEFAYDGGNGRVETLGTAARYAVTRQFDTRGTGCHGAPGAAQFDGAILVVSATDGPMP